MKNFWIQGESETAIWTADLSVMANAPESLLALVYSVYTAAEEMQVFLPVDVDVHRNISERWNSSHVVDYFQAGFLEQAKVEAVLSWYDAHDRIVTGPISDLGNLLALLAPLPDSIPFEDRQLGVRALRLSGSQLRYSGSELIEPQYQTMRFYICLRSDIWMPYVVGYAHPACDLNHGVGPVDWDTLKYFDNRELARRHTPRLNQLIAEIRRLVSEAGGTWKLDVDDSKRAYLPWLSDEGVLLDGHTPPLMDSSLGDDWSSRYDWAADHNR